MLPLAVLGTFVAMKVTGVDANVMSLAGIAIAIGIGAVDPGIIIEIKQQIILPGFHVCVLIGKHLVY